MAKAKSIINGWRNGVMAAANPEIGEIQYGACGHHAENQPRRQLSENRKR
jgi:hypothetical protein